MYIVASTSLHNVKTPSDPAALAGNVDDNIISVSIPKYPHIVSKNILFTDTKFLHCDAKYKGSNRENISRENSARL
jgi:hypothetical protein